MDQEDLDAFRDAARETLDALHALYVADFDADDSGAPSEDEDEEDDGCPKGDPECLGRNGDCHDACSTYAERERGADVAHAIGGNP